MITRHELMEYCRVAKDKRNRNVYGADSWAGSISHEQAVEKALHGDESYVAGAELLMDKLDASVQIDFPTWQPSPFGAYPIVAEFLAGNPDSMRRRMPEFSDISPVTVYVSTTCSAIIKAEDMLKRGTALLALVLKLQQFRPVEIYLLAETHGQTDGELLQVIRIESKPVNISIAAFTLCHVGFARHLTYGVAQAVDGFNGAWPNNYNQGGASWEKHVREVLGMGKDDLYIGAARAWDELITDPIAWVNAQVAKFTSREEE